MKKLILILAAAFLVIGCTPPKETRVVCEDGTYIYARKFMFEDHQYIEFFRDANMPYDHYTGFVHDPNCWCMEDVD